MDENRFNWHEWGTRLRINGGELHEYAEAVFASTDEYLAGLTDSDLEQKLETKTAVGERTVFDMLNGAVLFNIAWHTGEIAALKGQKGLKGYPF